MTYSNTLRPRLRNFFLVILAGIGAMWIVFHCTGWIFQVAAYHWFAQKAAATFLSPDGDLKAMVFLHTGGGAPDSYCSESVYVVPATDADREPDQQDNLIYSAACGGLSAPNWDNNITWKSSNVLELAFNPTQAAASGPTEINGYVLHGTVRVNFVFRPSADPG